MKLDVKSTIPFAIACKSIKYIEISLIKEVKYLYLENYKNLVKEMKEGTNKWKDMACPWIRRICLYYTNPIESMKVLSNSNGIFSQK